MITSKQLLKQIEQYSDTKNVSGHAVIIFENPTSSDILEISKTTKSSPKEVRFIADAKTRKVYVWDAYLAIHREILKQINVKYSAMAPPYSMIGEATINGNKLNFKKSDALGNWMDISLGPIPKSLTPQQKLNWDTDRSNANNEIRNYVNFDWSFADRYINGLNSYLKQQSQLLNDWLKKER
jgi:hypothetical protein